MQQSIQGVLAERRQEPEGLRRAVLWSLGVHVCVVVLLMVVPRHWLVKDQPAPILMTINLGGPSGERTRGMNPAGAQPVQEVAPPPKRQVPAPVASPPKADPVASVKSGAKVPPKPSNVPPTAAPSTRPPTTGTEVTRGTAPSQTGSKTLDTGLAGGGGAGGTDIKTDVDFCCPEYIAELKRRIERDWDASQPESGETVVVFEIRRDGSFTKPEVEKSSGKPMLDLASRAAFQKLTLPPLPKAYPHDTLRIHLAFPYKR